MWAMSVEFVLNVSSESAGLADGMDSMGMLSHHDLRLER